MIVEQGETSRRGMRRKGKEGYTAKSSLNPGRGKDSSITLKASRPRKHRVELIGEFYLPSG